MFKYYLEKETYNEAITKGGDFEYALINVINGKKYDDESLYKIAKDTVKKLNSKKERLSRPASKIKSAPISEFWQGRDNTSKADIKSSQKKISIKMGASQLMSGSKDESLSTLRAAALKTRMKQQDKELVEDLENMINKFKTLTIKGEVAQLKESSEELSKADALNKKIQSKLRNFFEENSNFKKNFIYEALSGEMKFEGGKKSDGFAEYLLCASPFTENITFCKTENEKLLNELSEKVTLGVRFKSTSIKKTVSGKKVKTGFRKAWPVLQLGVSEEELKEFEMLYTEAINYYDEGLVQKAKEIYNKVKTKIIEWANKILEIIKQGIPKIIELIVEDIEISKINFSEIAKLNLVED